MTCFLCFLRVKSNSISKKRIIVNSQSDKITALYCQLSRDDAQTDQKRHCQYVFGIALLCQLRGETVLQPNEQL